jgi:hypothetical protein
MATFEGGGLGGYTAVASSKLHFEGFPPGTSKQTQTSPSQIPDPDLQDRGIARFRKTASPFNSS